MSYQKKSQLSKSKTVVVIAVLVCLLGAGGYLYKSRHDRNTPPPPTNPPGTEKIDLSPATPEDQARADQHKEELVKRQGQRSQPQQNGSQVTPIVISASQTSVKGFMPGIYESGGTCEATFIKGSEKVTKQSASVKGATTTDCTPISLSPSDFPSTGDWTLVLSYKSSRYTGSSASQMVKVN